MHSFSPLVTIGLPTYNRANGYLRSALDSAIIQTWTDLEIIVSDNCSTDDTEEVVRSYTDPRINYVKHKRNTGAANNFNYCLSRASGEYFFLLHDDDVIDPDFIEVCMRSLSDSPLKKTGIIRTGTRLINGTGDVVMVKPNYTNGMSNTDFLLEWFADKTTLYLCSTLFNTNALKEAGGFVSDTNLFNDVAAMLRLADKYGRLDIPHCKAGFRRHDENCGSMANVENWVKDSEYILSIIKKNGY